MPVVWQLAVAFLGAFWLGFSSGILVGLWIMQRQMRIRESIVPIPMRPAPTADSRCPLCAAPTQGGGMGSLCPGCYERQQLLRMRAGT